MKSKYEEIGIPPAIKNNYFQDVPLQILKTPKVEFTVNNEGFEYFDHYISYSSAPSQLLEDSKVIFAGYGIDHENFNDYENLDVKGKIVVVKGGEPKDKAGNFIVTGTKEISKWSNGRQAISSKRDAAKVQGAKALILIDSQMFGRYSAYFKRQVERGGSNRLSLIEQNNDDIHFFLAGKELGKQLVPEYDSKNKAETVNSKISINYERIAVPIASENVVAYIKGNEKPDEYVVISAHLD
ncbi:MAG: peptidase, partial [Bacteroidia bacterium]|nr:peptidase [Bacteroidia bacterium]